MWTVVPLIFSNIFMTIAWYGRFTPVQLKVIQEIVTLTVFGVFTTYYFGSHLHWNHGVAAVFLAGAAFLAFHSF